MRKTMILLLFSFLLAACSDSPVCYYLDATGGGGKKNGVGPGGGWKKVGKKNGGKI